MIPSEKKSTVTYTTAALAANISNPMATVARDNSTLLNTKVDNRYITSVTTTATPV